MKVKEDWMKVKGNHESPDIIGVREVIIGYYAHPRQSLFMLATSAITDF